MIKVTVQALGNSDLAGRCGIQKPSPGSEAAGSGASSARKTVQWTVFSGSSARKTVQWTVFSENGSADPR